MMRLQKTFFVLILLASFQICFGQEKPKAEQVDEFGTIGCDDFLARVDNFSFTLKDEPSLTGYAIIYADKDSKQAKGYESLLNGQIYLTKFDSRRIVVKHAEKEDSFRVVLWKVPAGADLPTFAEQKAFYVLPPSTKAFRFATSFYDICPTLSPKHYADYLKANPNMRGHIVVFVKSTGEAKKRGENWLKTLTKEYDVPRNRLKIFYSKNQSSSEGTTYKSATEFWLVPQKKK